MRGRQQKERKEGRKTNSRREMDKQRKGVNALRKERKGD